MAYLNLDDDAIPFMSFFHFFSKCKGRKYFFRNRKKVFTVVIGIHGRNMPTLYTTNLDVHDSYLNNTSSL